MKLHELGTGAYGVVYKAERKQSGSDPNEKKHVAIKATPLFDQLEGLPTTTLREITLLKGLRHSNIVELLDVIPDKKENKLFLVIEFMDYDLGQFLEAHCRNSIYVPEEMVKSCMVQILQGTRLSSSN